MTRLLRDLRTLGIALAAVAGVLSVPGTAPACTAGAATEAAGSCCAGSPAGACSCCVQATALTAPAGEPRVDAHRSPAHRLTPAGPCVCRAERPNAPARAPTSRPVDRPTDRLSGGTVNGLTIGEPSPRPFSPALSPSGATPGRPVYLRTARLLI